mmetsp:Transcript_818/g.2628  ORF Transcript_818/g.2628 Transcript_818/m.2628 type:complete len:199 (-) Transcript_818:1-597(-)
MTFAFHAIHAATLEAKLGRVGEAIAASGTTMVGRCQPSDVSAGADPKAEVAASELLVQEMLAASGERSTEWLLLLRSSGGAAQLRAQLTTEALASMAGESDFVVEYSSELVRPVARTGSGDQHAPRPLAACRRLRRYRDSTGTNHLSICRTDLPRAALVARGSVGREVQRSELEVSRGEFRIDAQSFYRHIGHTLAPA